MFIISIIDKIDWFPIGLSFQVAVLSTIFSLVIGLAIAYILARRRVLGREIIDALISLPLVLPPTVLGYYLLVLLGVNSSLGRIWEAIFGHALVFTWQAAVVAAVIHSLPLVVKSARAAIENVPESLEQAARVLGAGEARVFFTITLPLAGRGILAATVLAFARSLGDFGITLMIAGNIPGRTQTAALAIYDAVQAGRDNQALTMVVIISFIAVITLYIMSHISKDRF